MTKANQNRSMKELTMTRVFDAPRDLVWKAWTDPGQMKRWFGPKTFTTPVCQIDLRVGGGFLLCMRSPEGKDYWVKGVYREIAPPERLIYADYFSDAEGNIVSPTEHGLSADFPSELLITVTFTEHEGKTKMTVQMPAPESKEGDKMQQGWNESFDKLAEDLKT